MYHDERKNDGFMRLQNGDSFSGTIQSTETPGGWQHAIRLASLNEDADTSSVEAKAPPATLFGFPVVEVEGQNPVVQVGDFSGWASKKVLVEYDQRPTRCYVTVNAEGLIPWQCDTVDAPDSEWEPCLDGHVTKQFMRIAPAPEESNV